MFFTVKKYVVYLRPAGVARRKYFKLADGKNFGLVEKKDDGEKLSRKNADLVIKELRKKKFKSFDSVEIDRQRVKKRVKKRAA